MIMTLEAAIILFVLMLYIVIKLARVLEQNQLDLEKKVIQIQNKLNDAFPPETLKDDGDDD